MLIRVVDIHLRPLDSTRAFKVFAFFIISPFRVLLVTPFDKAGLGLNHLRGKARP
jgi:hypothetical protein